MAIDPNSPFVTKGSAPQAVVPVDVNQDSDGRSGSEAFAQAVWLANPPGESAQTFTEHGELLITETEREHNVRASFARTGIVASSWAVLVDLSDTVNFPHDESGRIDISVLSAQVDRATNSVGLMQLGVVTRVSATNGDVMMFSSVRFEHGDGPNIIRDVNLAPSQIKCGVVGGVPTRMISNVSVVNDTGLQNDVALDSPRGVATVIPAPGDIVIRYVHTSGAAWTGAFGVLYHGEPTA